MPAGYAVTEINPNLSVCRGVKRWELSLPRDNMSVCSNTIFPSGFGVTSINNTASGCEGMYRWTIRSLTDGLKICAGTPDPTGFSVTSYSSSISCAGAGAYTIRTPADNQLICADTGVPSGFVITATVSSGVCGSADANRIRIPSVNMIVCGYSPLPTGWQTAGQVATSQCATPYGWKITSLGPPTASFVYTAVELWVQFEDTSIDSTGITAWQWSFGDGKTSSLQDPEHEYASSGTYTVTLKVTDADGHTDTTSRTIAVTAPTKNITPIITYLLAN
jgi:hypothetical protein